MGADIMTKNYFAIERHNKGAERLTMHKDDGTIAFEDVMNMSYDEIKQYENIDSFIVAVMDAANQYFNTNDEDTLITLVGDDDVFIWSILIGCEGDSEDIRYAFIDWLKEGRKYRYEKN